jgi:1,4-alpha-glucan branching enzyme
MSTEVGQWTEWNHDAEVDWALRTFETHEGIRRMMCDLNRLYSSEPALHDGDVVPQGFEWIVGDDQTNVVVAFLRQTQDASEIIVVVSNLTPAPREQYRLGVPRPGFYKEIFNSDAAWYGGAGIGNQGGVYSKAESAHGRAQSISITVPPLATLCFKAITQRPCCHLQPREQWPPSQRRKKQKKHDWETLSIRTEVMETPQQ